MPKQSAMEFQLKCYLQSIEVLQMLKYCRNNPTKFEQMLEKSGSQARSLLGDSELLETEHFQAEDIILSETAKCASQDIFPVSCNYLL